MTPLLLVLLVLFGIPAVGGLVANWRRFRVEDLEPLTEEWRYE